MKNTYCPKRGKKGKRSENFAFSFFKEKLKLNAKLFPRGIFNEDILLIINNIDILVEVENKDMKNWSTCLQSFPSNEYINFSSRRKIRQNCFQMVFNNSHTKFLIYSHDVIRSCKEETEINSETGEIYKVRKIPVSLSKEFSVWSFDLEDFYGIINSKENLKNMLIKDNKGNMAARYSWTLKGITKNQKHLNIKVMDVVADWAYKVDEYSTAKKLKPQTEADKYIRQKYKLSESELKEFKDKIGISKKTSHKSPLSSYTLVKTSKGKTCDQIREYIENKIKSVKEEILSKRSENKPKQQPSSSASLPDISKEYNSVNVEEKMPSSLSKLKEIINSNISDDLKEELIKKLTQ